MTKEKRHIVESAAKRSSSFSRPKAVASCFVAFFLALSMFPFQAFADGTSALTTSANTTPSTTETATTTNPSSLPANTTSSANSNSTSTSVMPIVFASDNLNLIQNGNYIPPTSASIASTFASSSITSTGATPSTAQRNQIKARVENALMNVEYQSSFSYSSGGAAQTDTDLWCVVDVSDLNAPLDSGAETYAKTLVEEIVNNNPDLFYVGKTATGSIATKYVGTTTTRVLAKIYIRYYYKAGTIKSMKTKYETAMQSVLSWVNTTKSYQNSTDAEKAKAVHDWLVRNAKYNYAAYLKGGPTGFGSWDPWTAYGAIVTKSPVCEGYSLAFIAAMKRLGIQATFVTNANHGWNRVRLKVGSSYYWYNLDVTYDDPLQANDHYADGGYNKTPSTDFFLKSDSVMKGKDSTHAKWTPAGTAGTNTSFNSWGGGVYPLSSNTHTVNSISLSASQLNMHTNSSTTLKLSASGSNVIPAMAQWTSSNSQIASVNSTGLITTGTKTGTATITVKLGGKTAKCIVRVYSGNKTLLTSAAFSPNSQQPSDQHRYESGYKYEYKSATARRPAVTVKAGSTTLKLNTDYTVTYPTDSINPGTKTVTITGKGNYGGSFTLEYSIYASMSSVQMSATTITTTYTGSAQKKAPTLTFKGSLNKTITLKEGTDFTLSFSPDNTSPGTKKATIKGKNGWTGSKSYTLIIKPGANATWTRISGSTALATMAAITTKFGTASTAVVAANTNFKDSLAAAGLAGSLGAPLLTTSTSSLSSETANELRRMGVTTVYLVGSTKDLSDTIKNKINALPKVSSVQRISGNSASEKAIACAKKQSKRSSTVIIATQASFKDALSVSPYAYAAKSPILYAESNKKLSSTTLNYIKSAGFKNAIIVGGPVALPTSIETQLASVGIPSSKVNRLAGSNPYTTSRVIAEWATGNLKNGTGGGSGVYKYASIKFQPEVKLSFNKLGLARADNPSNGWKDALAGSALCGKNRSVILLADASNTSNTSVVSAYKTLILQAYVFGGTSAVPESVKNKFVTASKH
ncbi:MAG: cell wall-binding repeat-containing protein [Eggerthellaceae bacterium]|nr:cell wall-binding repeat-containing protein [Eggerthellaceae bacterium]